MNHMNKFPRSIVMWNVNEMGVLQFIADVTWLAHHNNNTVKGWRPIHIIIDISHQQINGRIQRKRYKQK